MNILPLILAAMWTMQSVMLTAAQPLTNTIGDDFLYDKDLFEGDIIITREEIEKYYIVPPNDQFWNVSVNTIKR